MSDWTPPEEEWTPDGTSGKAVDTPPPPRSQNAEMEWVPGRSNEETAKIISQELAGSGLLKTWSASGLKSYEECAHRLRLSKVDKIEGVSNPAANRGTAIHNIAENYVMSTWDSIEESAKPFIREWEEKIFPKWEERMNALRDLYADGKVEVEGEWGFDKEWETTGWMAPDVWARMKLDVLVWEDETCAEVIDYKTGRKFGNEMVHATQGMIYAIGTFMRYPSLEFLSVVFWYLDHNQESVQRYSRQQAMQFLPRITDRAVIMTSDNDLVPRPSAYNCKWCDYNKNEACEWRVNG